MTHITVSRPAQGLSGRSPAGRSLAFEFSRIRGITPVLENEIFDRVEKDPSFRVMQQSGMAAVPELKTGFLAVGSGRTPVGVLSYKLRMPGGGMSDIAMSVRIYMGPDGSPIFQVGKSKFNDLDTAAILMSVAIRHLLTKE